MSVRRVVVKVGSRLLSEEGGGLSGARLAALAADVARVRESGVEVVVVSSGAIACGWPRLGLPARPRSLPELQASAAAGQSLLMRGWEDALGRHGLTAAQVLLVHADVAHRRRYLNARGAIVALLELGAVPVVNENDTVAVAEIRYGDNDNLSADVAALVDADLLVLLTDIEGLYTADPRVDPRATVIPHVVDIDREAAPFAGGAAAGPGTGGMVTKVEAARKATRVGIPVVVCDGRPAGQLPRLVAGESVGTRFEAGGRLAARKHWIAYTLKVEGTLVLDGGAATAIAGGKKSLLPSGVTRVEGSFRRGAAVRCVGPDGRELARGLVAYDAADARRIAGKRSAEIETILGFTFGDALVHKDELVLTEAGSKAKERGRA